MIKIKTMKLYLTTLLIALSTVVFSQNRVGISEVLMNTAQGEQPAFEFFVPDKDAKSFLESWTKFHKDFKVKPKQDKNQTNYYLSDNAQIIELSENTIDIYARIFETNGGVRFTCAFDLGGVFISPEKTPEKYTKTKLLLNKFYAQMAMDAIVAEIEKELAELEKIKTEYDAIEKEIKVFESQTVEITAAIANQEKEQKSLESNISDKESELMSKTKDLDVKKEELKVINKAGMIASLTTFETDLKKVVLESTKIEKDIVRKEAEIATINAEINIMKNDLVTKNTYKADLEQKIDAIVEKLESLDIDKKEENVKLLEQNILQIEKSQTDLELKKSAISKEIQTQKDKLVKANSAIAISKETKLLLKDKMDKLQLKLKEMEELKATIE
jgi:hypothetical protein